MMNDFEKFAVSNGIGTLKLDGYNKFVSKQYGYIEPYILEERQLNCQPMSVYSRLMMDRIIFLGSEVNEDVANIVTSELMYLNSIDSEADVKLFINSPGGSVTDGLAIYDVMNWITPDVSTCCMGLSASMGAVLLSSGAKGKRFSLPHGDIMIHQPLGGMRGQAADMRIEMQQMEKCQKTLYEILAENTGRDYDTIKADCDRNNWMTAEEAVNYGLIDAVKTKAK